MAVVINEFEVVPDATPQPKEKPDLADVLRRLHERAERVRAH